MLGIVAYVGRGIRRHGRRHARVAAHLVHADAALPRVAEAIAKAKSLNMVVVGTTSSTLPGASGQALALSGPARSCAAEEVARRDRQGYIDGEAAPDGSGDGEGFPQNPQGRKADARRFGRPARRMRCAASVPTSFQATLEDGVDKLQAGGADVMFMNMQYSPRTDAVISTAAYADAIRWVALEHAVNVFDRFGDHASVERIRNIRSSRRDQVARYRRQGARLHRADAGRSDRRRPNSTDAAKRRTSSSNEPGSVFIGRRRGIHVRAGIGLLRRRRSDGRADAQNAPRCASPPESAGLEHAPIAIARAHRARPRRSRSSRSVRRRRPARAPPRRLRSYPSRLEAELKAQLPGLPITVLNKGIGGEEAPQMVARFDADVIDEKPDLVLWQVGSNSVLRDHPTTAAK